MTADLKVKVARRMKVRKFVLISLFLFTAHVQAADSETWASVQIEQALNEKWAVLNELIYRQSFEINDRQVSSGRLGIQYTTESGLKIANLFENRTTASARNAEFRNIFQTSDKYEFEYVQLSGRFRFENRRFADSDVWMTRYRLLARLDFTALETAWFLPFLATEQFYIANDVASRLAGSRESRVLLGFVSDLGPAKLETSYLDRRVTTPSSGATPATEMLSNVLNFVLKFSLE